MFSNVYLIDFINKVLIMELNTDNNTKNKTNKTKGKVSNKQ
ncbi:hypothetical protein [Helicobacter bilis]|nr:hypothetical protein [Helicobacter bilis]